MEEPGLLSTGRRRQPGEWLCILVSPGADYSGPCSVVTWAQGRMSMTQESSSKLDSGRRGAGGL